MLLSRFWFFALAAVAAATAGAFLLSQAAFNRQYDSALTKELRRDRYELELILKLDARARLDAIAPITVHSDVRTGLARASGRSNPQQIDSALQDRLENKLRELNNQLEGLKGDIVFAVDKRGYIIAQLGADDPPSGAALGAFPLVERALAGWVRDDVWVYNDNVYRMAARPVIDSGQVVGAIVHGMLLNDSLASRLSERIGDATVAFFFRDRVIGRHMPPVENAARAEDVEQQLSAAFEDESFQQGGHTEPIAVAAGNSRAVYSLVTGSAAHSSVGYAIARPRKELGGFMEIFDQVADQDVNEFLTAKAPFVGGAAILAFIFAMFFVWLERDRPLRKLRRAAEAVGKREQDRFTITDFGGVYRKITQAANDAIDKAVEKAADMAPQRKAANLDEILGPTPEAGKAPAFFGFAGQEGGASEVPSAPPPAAPGPPPAAAMPPPPARPAAPAMKPVGPGAPPPMPPKPVMPPKAPTMPKVAPKPLGMAMGGPPGGPPAAMRTMAGIGSPSASPVPAPAMPELGPAIGDDDDDEVQTTVAPVPKELLAEVNLVSDEGAHFRNVYEQFIATKKECGEPTTGLTFEKFEKTLNKNRNAIVSRHGAKSVKFTVYVKEGKAALKATPLK